MILIISCVFPPEPVVSASISFQVAEFLTETNEVVVLSPRPSRPEGFIFSESFNHDFPFIHIISKSFTCANSSLIGRLRESYSFGLASYRFIRSNNKEIDVIYLNTWPLFGQFLATMAARRYNIPVVLHVQDIYPESLISKLPKFKRLIKFVLLPLDKWVQNYANSIVAISEKMKFYLVDSRGLDESKFHVIHNWQKLPDSPNRKVDNTESRVKKDFFTFMYLGNIGPVAGCELLIDAFRKIAQEGVRLVIAGAGSSRQQLVDWVKTENIENVEFWSVPDGEVVIIQNMADVLLLPIKKGSSLTSIPSKLPAYMFSSKPILATVDAGCDTADAIQQADCGWVIDPENPELLYKQMLAILSESTATLVAKGNCGYKYAMVYFNPQTQLEKLSHLILDNARSGN